MPGPALGDALGQEQAGLRQKSPVKGLARLQVTLGPGRTLLAHVVLATRLEIYTKSDQRNWQLYKEGLCWQWGKTELGWGCTPGPLSPFLQKTLLRL